MSLFKKEYIYITNKPFIQTLSKDTSYSKKMTTQDLHMQNLMFDYVDTWCRSQGWIEENDTILVSADREFYDVKSMVGGFLYRDMLLEDYRTSILRLLVDTEIDHTTSRVLNLHLSIISLIDTSYLDMYINRLYKGLEITEEPQGQDTDMTWKQFHLNYPYFWVFFLLQSTLHKYPFTFTKEK
jgi:hypothetical protein